MKECRDCKKLVALVEFKKIKDRSTGAVYVDKVCNPCRAEMSKERRRKGITRASLMYLCIHDPTGIYYDGRFNEGDVKKTAREGYWPPGMIWLDQKTGTKYRIEGNDVYYYMHADLMNEPLPEVNKEKQILVVIP